MKRNTTHQHPAPEPTYTVVSHVISGPNTGLKEHETWKVYLAGGITVTAHRRQIDKYRARYANSRVYGALDALVPQLMALEPFRGESIPLAPEHADDKVKAAMWAAWKRSTIKETTALLAPLLKTVAADLSLWAGAVDELKFSATAGCSCPCSPGFILGGAWDNSDIWITVDEDAATAS